MSSGASLSTSSGGGLAGGPVWVLAEDCPAGSAFEFSISAGRHPTLRTRIAESPPANALMFTIFLLMLRRMSDVFPIFQPLIIGSQAGPGPIHGPLQVGPFFYIQFPPFFNRQGHIIHLLLGDQAGHGSGDGGIT